MNYIQTITNYKQTVKNINTEMLYEIRLLAEFSLNVTKQTGI